MQMSIYIIQILFNFKISSVWYEQTQKEVWSTEKHASITLHRALPVFSVIDNWTKSKFDLFLLRLDQMFPRNKNSFALSNSNK